MYSICLAILSALYVGVEGWGMGINLSFMGMGLMFRVICSCFIYADQALRCCVRSLIWRQKIRYIIQPESIFSAHSSAHFRIFQTFEEWKAAFRLEGAFFSSLNFAASFLFIFSFSF